MAASPWYGLCRNSWHARIPVLGGIAQCGRATFGILAFAILICGVTLMRTIVSNNNQPVAFVFAVFLFVLPLSAAHTDDREKTYQRANPEDVVWWQDARFGMFIGAWGPVSLKGAEISWSREGERRGATEYEQAAGGEIPAETYDSLYEEFNPVEFDAREWVAIARAAGMKYLVFISKHHDGFCMFNSALTDYKITNSPFGRDVVGELAQACHDLDFPFGLYYSPADWHHPDYRTENHQRYIDYLHGQLRELCTNYGRIDIIWFDGLRCKPADWDSEKLFKMIRGLQPHTLINNRAGLPGDFDTPEQRIGRFQRDRPWESCMTIGTQWAWKPNDTLRSLRECIDILVRCAGGDGNLLLHVGPTHTGEIEPQQVGLVREIGEWLRLHGRSIYGTRGGPFRPGPWGASTHKGNTVYLHILDWPRETLMLSNILPKIVSASLLESGESLAGDSPVRFEQSGDSIEIQVAPDRRHSLDTMVLLKLDEPVSQIQPEPLESDVPVEN